MTDAVTISLIGAILSFSTAVLGAIVALLTLKMKTAMSETRTAISETKDAMVFLEKNTNSIKDELVKVTGEQQRAIGNLEGRAELKDERLLGPVP